MFLIMTLNSSDTSVLLGIAESQADHDESDEGCAQLLPMLLLLPQEELNNWSL